MKAGTDKQKLFAFMEAIGRDATSPGRLYLVGGSTALLLGVRDQTLDIDIKVDPEPDMIRYPAINVQEYSESVQRFVRELSIET